MTKHYTYSAKSNGDVLNATEWNNLAQDVSAAVDAINNGAVGSGSSSNVNSSFLYMNDKGNLCLETTAENTPSGKKGKINIESNDDIQLKPGDDIMLYGDHRGEGKTDEVSIKVMDGTGADDVPAKLQVNTSEITLTTKDKVGDDANVLDINVNRAKNTKGYLKVRAQAIDLRCEDHGGIALQPKGKDNQNHMNKIKFEHGGGDGLEFGTFNTEKTSIFTDEYRFNKEGVWKMATRETEVSDKADANDATTAYKYVKQSDDFYDVIDSNDAQCTTEDIIKTAAALNSGKDRHTKSTTTDHHIEIATNEVYVADAVGSSQQVVGGNPPDVETISTTIAAMEFKDQSVFNENDFDVLPSLGTVYSWHGMQIAFSKIESPKIKIQSGSNVEIDAANKIKFGGELDFGSTFNFGETDNGIEFQHKLTSKNKTKPCYDLKIVAVNNHSTNNLVIDQSKWVLSDPSDPTSSLVLDESSATIAPGETAVIANASLYDIIKLVNYMKSNEEGPWAPTTAPL